ncbi:MAG TPA: NAD(P)-binding domain-containing protein, partial [Rhizomicrobium sp.]|nr:NAD(P)-binding domain-containing protein [Rhizomicrobium sp.]
MQIGIVGLGRMGANIGRRLMKKGHVVVAFDRDAKVVKALVGATGVSSLSEMVEKITPPRAIWVMLPAGKITDDTVMALGDLLTTGDVVIDGGNSFYKDDIRRAKALKQKNIAYVDCGTSGGVWGLDRGYCMMIGGEDEIVQRLDPIFAALAPGEGSIDKTPGRDGRDPRVTQGYMHCGSAGAGHFVKMVHNGVE